MKTEFKIALAAPALLAQFAFASYAQADCRGAYLEAINQPSVVQSVGNAATGGLSILAVSGMVVGTAAGAIPAGIAGVGASATSYTNHTHRQHLMETYQMIDEALLGSGMSLNELASQTNRQPDEVAAVLRELNDSNRLCSEGLLLGDETRLLVSGILSSAK